MNFFEQRTLRVRAFTLIEMIMALAACVVVLAAIYGVFSRAVHLRDDAIERTREMRVRSRALAVLRNDLQNARVSNGTLAATFLGSEESQSGFPGYLRFMTTTARGPATAALVADLQQVEYYLIADPENSGRKAGILVRTVERNLLAQTREEPPEEALLGGIAAIELSFFDGQSWNPTWEVTEDDKTLPQAIRVTLEFVPSDDGRVSPPIELLMPWTTRPATEET
jgi:type II secretion system protein J